MDQPWSVTAVWEFRDAEYEVSASKSGESLTVQVEEMHTADQWRGQFEAKRLSRPIFNSRPNFVPLLFLNNRY